MLKAKQTIICQVTKNPIGAKGARLTQEVSLPGRFVVLIPNSSTYGISKRLPDDERKRLRSILDKVKPKQHGVIVRTAAEGDHRPRRSSATSRRLLEQWDQIDALAKRDPGPGAALPRARHGRAGHPRGVQQRLPRRGDRRPGALRGGAATTWPPSARSWPTGSSSTTPAEEALPLFERFHVHEQLHKALDRKVWLPSGGSLIIEHTEALTVIDVNTGKNVGTSSLEETVFRNNLEAADEIARQLRLRDIGGIIVIDFIDMEIRENRDEVIARVPRRAGPRQDPHAGVRHLRARAWCEMTRKRIGEGLLESLRRPLPALRGPWLVVDPAHRCRQIEGQPVRRAVASSVPGPRAKRRSPMYAVIKTGGKQDRVEDGQLLDVEQLGMAEGDVVTLTPGARSSTATPCSPPPASSSGATVTAKVVGEAKGPKINGFTYKNKSNQRKRWGHRQHYDTIEITGITKG